MVMGALTPLSPPRTLGDMTLLAQLGEGGMAKVYLAAVGEGALARPAAVKLLRADLPDHDYRTRFLDEARVVVRLHHNNLVDVRAAGEQDGQLYIVMEAVDGRDLADMWDRCAELGRAFPVALAVHIVREVLRGLHYAHTFPGLSLVHRDVSPSNVLVDWAGAVRLADFGLATSTLKLALTVPGVVFGKVGYMSPEQALREPLDGRADVYACGVMLWELITGRSLRDPREHDTDDVAGFEARPPSAYSRRVDPELDAIVLQALARERDARWSTADEMLRALGAWLSRHAPEVGQESLADLMAALFPGAREVEADQRESLLRGLQGHAGASKSMTVMYGRTPTDPVEDAANGTALEPVPHVEVELIPAGTVVEDRYRVLSKLGRGGMGTVYLGEHLTVGRNVAIKVLTHEWSRHPGVAQRFRAEARAASAAGHPNIVEVFDAGELPDGRLFLVMEFLTGRTLWEELQATGPMDVARACRVMRDVARAIRAAHEVGIVHRDLKPDNIMIADRDGEFIKVLDFGISASAEQEGDERLTVAGQTLGTPEYMAPEQALGREVTPLFDVYALGAIFYELLAGEPPLTGHNVVEVMTRKTTQAAPSIAEARADLPAQLVELIDDCLAIDPAARPSSVRLFLRRLEEGLRQLPRSSGASGGTQPAPEPASSSSKGTSLRRGGIALALLAAGAVAVGAWMVRGTEPASSATEPDQAGGERGLGTQTTASAGRAVATQTDRLEVGRAEGPDAGSSGETGPADADDSADEAMAVNGASAGADEAVVGDEAAPAVRPEGSPGAVEGSSPPSAESAAPSVDEGAAPAPSGESSVPPYRTARCAQMRRQADDSAANGVWSDVLRRTRARECWARRAERLSLEVRANKELQRWQACVNAGRGLSDPAMRRIVVLCEKRAAMP